MALEHTEAVLLKSFNWSESSRTVILFSKNHGKIVLIDKGGRRIKSKRGRLMSFSRLGITYYNSEKETSGYISDIELIEQFSLEKDGTLGRLAYASASCELLNLILPEEEKQENLYILFCEFLSLSDKIDKKYLPSLFIIFILRLIAQLGYHPSFGFCSGCSKAIESGKAGSKYYFSPQRGGIICETCKTGGDYYIVLSFENYRALKILQTSSLSDAEQVPIGYQQAVLMLEVVEEHLGYQAGIKHKLKSLDFLEKLKNSQH